MLKFAYCHMLKAHGKILKKRIIDYFIANQLQFDIYLPETMNVLCDNLYAPVIHKSDIIFIYET